MQLPPLPDTEAERLALLRQLCLLDTPPEPEFERAVDLARSISGCPIALISLIDAERQWFKAKRGLDAAETPRDWAFCAWCVAEARGVLWVEDARLDPRFAQNPLVLGPPDIRFYAGAPLTMPEGPILGTLCVIAPEPRPHDPAVAASLARLAAMVVDQILLRRNLAELDRRCLALEAAAETLQRQSTSKTQFIASMSHEIRNPLNVLLGHAALLEPRLQDAEDRASMAVIRDSGEALARLCNDLLDLSAAETGQLALDPMPVALDAVLEDLVRRYRPLAAEKGLGLSLARPLAGLGQWLLDRVRLEQILSNLLSNAVKFTRTGSIRLSAEDLGGAQGLRLSVVDTGPGFSAEDATRLFRRHARLDRSQPGAGLGLAVSRQLAEAMGGTLQAAGEPGRGAIFTLTLPVPRLKTAAKTMMTAVTGQTRPRVLVADDHPGSLALMQAILDQWGIEMQAASDGLQAEAILSAGLPHVAVLDHLMPGLSGLEVIRRQRARERATAQGGRVPILCLTASTERAQRSLLLEAGADRVLPKPVDLMEFSRSLLDCLPPGLLPTSG